MKPMECLKGKYLVLIKPNVAVSTKEAYMGITPKKPKESPSVSVLRPMEEWKEWLTNDFEESIFPLLPVLKEVKNALYEAGAIYASMSGSGSTVFGIFDTMPDISGNIKLSSSDYYAKTICL
jgi:4-diphosphocytidyl-2-C-methyl-D-erythritol kinase